MRGICNLWKKKSQLARRCWRMDSSNDDVREMKLPPAQLEIRHADGRIEHPQVKLEFTDVRLGPILATVIGVALTLIAVVATARTLFSVESHLKARRAIRAV